MSHVLGNVWPRVWPPLGGDVVGAVKEGRVKFLHCADLHLDSPLRGLARFEDAPVNELRSATRRAFERAVEVAIDEEVGAVVIAGDLYDGDRDDFQTAMFLQRQLHRLRDCGVRVVVAYGNHDAENEITRRLTVPDNTTVLPSSYAGSVVLDDLGIAFHGRSYPTRVVNTDFTADYPTPVPGLVNVGVLHTSLDGRPGHAAYAPCTPDGLVHRGYNYWALGHVHRREQIERDGVVIVFPGNVCGRDVGELGPKGVTVVEYDGDTVQSVAHRDVAPVVWHRLEVDASGVTSADGMSDVVLGQLAPLREGGSGVLHVARVVVSPSRSAFGQWVRDQERYESQLRADVVGGDGSLWLERIELLSPTDQRPAVGSDALAAVADTLEGLRHGASREIAVLLAGVRTKFGAERELAVSLGALGLDDASVDALVSEVEELLYAELETGA